MATIVTRQTTASGVTNNNAPLTNAQVDANFINLNTDKVENADCVSTNTANKVVKRDANGDFSARIITCLDVNSTSDQRLKENVSVIDSALDIIEKLEGVRFTMKADPEKMKIGLIAQQTEEVLPEVVGQDENGMKTVSYGNVVAVLIEAVKELSERVKTLESTK